MPFSAIPAIEVVGAGTKGIEEMCRYMEDCEVMWAIVRFEFGTGAFKRTKMLFLHFNGEETPVVRRGKANAKTELVREFLRGKDGVFHCSIQRLMVSELTIENVMEEVSKTIVIDSMESPVAMMREYHEQMAREEAAAAAAYKAYLDRGSKAKSQGDGAAKPQETDTSAKETAEAPSNPQADDAAPEPPPAETIAPTEPQMPSQIGPRKSVTGGRAPSARRGSVRMTVRPASGVLKDPGIPSPVGSGSLGESGERVGMLLRGGLWRG